MTLEKLFPSNPWFDLNTIEVDLEEKSGTVGSVPEKTYIPNPAPHGSLPVNLNIQQDQPIEVHFRWNQTGFLVPFPLPMDYHMEVFLEKMGSGADRDFAITLPYMPTNACATTIQIPNNIAIPADRLAVGVYKIVAVFKFSLTGNTNAFVAAFKEIGMLNVYQQELL